MFTIKDLGACVLVDLETRSDVPIEYGAHRYFGSRHAGILSATFRVMGRNVEPATLNVNALQGAGELEDSRARLNDLLDALGGGVWWVAHNADGFERHAFDTPLVGRDGWTINDIIVANTPTLGAWIDTATLARMHGLPGGLDASVGVLGLDVKKSPNGKKLIKRFSIPTEEGGHLFNAPEDHVEEFQEFVDYNINDVDVMDELADHLDLDISPDYLRDSEALRELNDRGVPVDAALAETFAKIVAAKRLGAEEELSELTNGEVTTVFQTKRILLFLEGILEVCALDAWPTAPIALVWKNLAKAATRNWKSLDSDARDKLMSTVVAQMASRLDEELILQKFKRLIEIVDEARSSSLDKYGAMVNRFERHANDPTPYVFDNYMHAGAGQTTRYSSTGLQMHNMNRKTLDVDEWGLLTTTARDCTPERVSSKLLARGVRQVFTKPGHIWVVGDWTAIEARELPWLADSPGAERKLDAHRNPERDVYREAADNVGLDPETNRQQGKVIELALGFGGGDNALVNMAANYGMSINDFGVKPKVIVREWREANQWAVNFWDDLMTAAKCAVRHPGQGFAATGKVDYKYYPDMLNGQGALVATIQPCGTKLVYPSARYRGGELFYKPAKYGGLKEVSLWHGVLAENSTQCGAGSILRRTLASDVCRAHARLHTHDEIGLLVRYGWQSASAVNQLQHEMTTALEKDYAGLPLEAEIYTTVRYGKEQ